MAMVESSSVSVSVSASDECEDDSGDGVEVEPISWSRMDNSLLPGGRGRSDWVGNGERGSISQASLAERSSRDKDESIVVDNRSPGVSRA